MAAERSPGVPGAGAEPDAPADRLAMAVTSRRAPRVIRLMRRVIGRSSAFMAAECATVSMTLF